MRQMGAGQNGLATVGSSECYGVTNGCGQHEVPGVLGSWVQHEGPGFESSDLLAVAAPAGATPTRSRCPRGPALVPCAPEAATASATSSNAHARVQLDGLAPTTPMACKAARFTGGIDVAGCIPFYIYCLSMMNMPPWPAAFVCR